MGVSERRGGKLPPLRYGMHVIDGHDQVFGTVLLVRKDHFVVRQDLAMNQLILLPSVTISGVIGSMVFLNVTPGEILLVGKILERRERTATGGQGLKPRVVRPILGEAI